LILLENISTNNAERDFSQILEEHGSRIPKNQIFPGMYYSFQIPVPGFNPRWVPDSEEDYRKNPDAFITDRQYYDLIPFGPVFLHEKWNEIALQLNIKILPPQIRLKVIMAHVNLIKEDLDRIGFFSEDKEESYMSPVEIAKAGLRMSTVTPSNIESIVGVKLGYAINAYRIERINNPKILEWYKIGEIPKARIDARGLAIASSLVDIAGLFEQFERKQLMI
jgi:hypothetical protein